MNRKKRCAIRSTKRPDKGPERLTRDRAVARASRNWATWLLLVGLLLATLAAYQPSWHGGMLWDDDRHVTQSGLRTAEGLWRIWFHIGATQQYYPMAHSAFWFQHKLWGDDTFGYHLVNIILHAVSAFLVAIILRRLGVPGAYIAAAIFALHPVHVESVAWISELKNTLSGVLYLAAALTYLHFDKSRKKIFYALALVLFIAALLSKTVTASLPAGLLVAFWWQRGRLSWRSDVKPLVPFFFIGAAGAALTAVVERTLIGAQGGGFEFTLIERCLIAGRAIWFYLGKLFWPAHLIFIYPRWHISHTVWWQYLYPIAALGLVVGSWLVRKRSRAPLAAVLYYCGTLFPALGFFNLYPFRYSFVADHFQYLASIAMIALFSAGLARVVKKLGLDDRFAKAGVIALVSVLAFQTWSQSHQYEDAETLYRTTLSRNPSCWLAHNNLGALKLDSSTEEAMEHFKASLRLEPDNPEAHNNLGNALQMVGRFEEALTQHQDALRLKPDFAEAYNNLGTDLQKLGRLEEAAIQQQEALRIKPDFAGAHYNLGTVLQSLGRHEEAERHYNEALRLNPDLADAHYNLGNLLKAMGRYEAAAAQYREALRSKPGSAEIYNNLGVSLLGLGRAEEAVTNFEDAMRLKPDFAGAHFNLGNVLQGMGRNYDAVAQYREALRYDPASVDAHNNLGVALVGLGRLEEAVVQFNDAMRLKPDYADARANLNRASLLLKTRKGP